MTTSIMAEGRFLRLINEGGWEYVERRNTSGVIAIVAISRDQRLILVEQYRKPIKSRTIETPAGLAGDIPGQEHEALEVAARRELEEEAGYSGGNWKCFGATPSSSGLTNELITFFVAQDVVKTSEGGGDESEDIRVHEIPLSELRTWLAARAAEGLMIDYKIYAGLCLAQVSV